MPDVIEPAPTGRAKCRACGRPIAKGQLRFGERTPNPFGEGEASFWFHVACAACKRPEQVLAVLQAAPGPTGEFEALLRLAQHGVQHDRLPRIAGAEPSPSARARCRHCHETIDKGSLRLALDWWEDGRFAPAGFVHAACAGGYFGSVTDVVQRLQHLRSELDHDELARVQAELVRT